MYKISGILLLLSKICEKMSMRLLHHIFWRSDQEYLDSSSTSYPKSFIIWIILLIITIYPGCTIEEECPGCTTEEEVDYYGIFEEYKGFLQTTGRWPPNFLQTAQDDPTLAGLPFKSGCAYVRWTWGDLERKRVSILLI